MNCPHCDAKLPDDARFCIECGQEVPLAATGATQRLPDAVGGTRCPACGTSNPPGALYCVFCGTSQVPGVPQPARATPESRRFPVVEAPAPTLVPPEMPASLAPVPGPARPDDVEAWRVPRRRRRGGWAMHPRHRAKLGGLTGALFLFGLAFLFFTNWFWPGILVLLGVTGAIGSLASPKPATALLPLVFFVGLAYLFSGGAAFFFPGILVLLGIMALLSPIVARS